MNSSYMFYNFYPIILNFILILIISLPSKFNKFNPINLILLLIIMTLIISLKMNMMINSWGSYIIFLIIIGGLMIIFMYIMSVASNELFFFKLNFLLMNMMKLIPILLLLLIYMYMNLYMWNNNFIWNNFLIFNFKLNFYEIYQFPYYKIIFFIMNYLFYSMICIMNMCYKMKLPLRQLFF